jgi:hypothetical protein
LDKYTPPFLDADNPAWIASYDLGHFSFAEVDAIREKTDAGDLEMMASYKEARRYNASKGIYDGFMGVLRVNALGKAFGDFHLITARIKKALDVNNVANPTRLVDLDEFDDVEQLNRKV